MATEIDKEIEQLAEKMTKSVVAGKQALFDTIVNLGPEGLKKALPTLPPPQQELVREAIEEMSKATHKPTKTDDADHLTPAKTQTKHSKMKAESESGSDDQDEKLMEDKNRDIKHQGGPSDKPEGWEGQVIKAKEPPHKGPNGGIIIGHTRDGKPIYEHAGHESHKDFGPDQHRDAAEEHQKLSDKHWNDKNQSPYGSVSGLQSMGGKKRKFKEAKAQYEKDAGEHKLHSESSAFHRRMADHKSGAQIGDLTPDDHKAQADRHMDRVNQLHEMRKCGYSNLMKDMGQGAGGGIGLMCSDQSREAEGKFNKAYENFMTKAEKEELAKTQGVPEGVSPEKHEDCVHDVKAEGHGKVSAIKICNASMAKKSFAEVEEHAKEEGARDPKAVAAAVGIKELGKEEMERRAQAGKKKAMKKGDDMENLSPEQKLEKKKMRKARKIAKSIKRIVKMAKALGMSKDDVKKAIEAANGDLKIVKSEMKSKINKEENQVEIKTQDESAVSAPVPPQDKAALEIKPDETADEALKKLPKVEKSVKWGFKNSVAAGTLGRNTHWDVDAYIEKSEQEKQETIKKGAYFNEPAAEELKKSEPEKKADLNDLIEKGFDYSTEEIARLEGIKNYKPDADAVVRKGNYDVEIARSMGISEEEYKKIFGSNEDY
jgi:hypothetical protein